MTSYPYFSARRDPRTRRWQGWVQFEHAGHISYTPKNYATKSEAVAAVKAMA